MCLSVLLRYCLKTSCLDSSWKNGVAAFSQLFLMASISYLQVTMTYVRAWMSLKFGQIRLLVSMATHRVIMEKWCCHFFSAVFYPILFILAGNDNMHESSGEFEIRPDLTTNCGVSCPLASGKIPIGLLCGKMVLSLFLSYSCTNPFHTCR